MRRHGKRVSAAETTVKAARINAALRDRSYVRATQHRHPLVFDITATVYGQPVIGGWSPCV